MNKTVALGCDHGGFILKAAVVGHLEKLGYTVLDCGTDSEARCDYPVFAEAVATAITEGKARLGILICGTGIGMSMAANKVRGIRAACCSEPYSARMTRCHNDANVLCFGARVVGEGTALELLDAFLGAEYEGGRHDERVALIRALEEKQ